MSMQAPLLRAAHSPGHHPLLWPWLAVAAIPVVFVIVMAVGEGAIANGWLSVNVANAVLVPVPMIPSILAAVLGTRAVRSGHRAGWWPAILGAVFTFFWSFITVMSVLGYAAGSAVPASTYAATLSAPAAATVGVPTVVTVRVTPAPANAVAQIQVGTTSGWVRIEQVAVGSNGVATANVSSEVTGTRAYRAAIIQRSNGHVLANSKPVDIAWRPVTYTAALACTKSTAVVRVEVPCSITVTPAVRLSGLVAQVQVKGMSAWVPIDTWSIPASGVRSITVTGVNPGLGQYRVRLVRAGLQVAVSNTVSIAWTAR